MLPHLAAMADADVAIADIGLAPVATVAEKAQNLPRPEHQHREWYWEPIADKDKGRIVAGRVLVIDKSAPKALGAKGYGRRAGHLLQKAAGMAPIFQPNEGVGIGNVQDKCTGRTSRCATLCGTRFDIGHQSDNTSLLFHQGSPILCVMRNA